MQFSLNVHTTVMRAFREVLSAPIPMGWATQLLFRGFGGQDIFFTKIFISHLTIGQ